MGPSLVAQTVKYLPAMWETAARFLGKKDPLEQGMLPTPVFLPEEWTEDPGRLQSIRVANANVPKKFETIPTTC